MSATALLSKLKIFNGSLRKTFKKFIVFKGAFSNSQRLIDWLEVPFDSLQNMLKSFNLMVNAMLQVKNTGLGKPVSIFTNPRLKINLSFWTLSDVIDFFHCLASKMCELLWVAETAAAKMLPSFSSHHQLWPAITN